MTANDLYKMIPKNIHHSIHELVGCYYNHIKEADPDESFITMIMDAPDIEIRVIYNKYIDFRRYWQLASVWYKDTPVMIIQNAGREGDDHARRFITNIEAFRLMIDYIKTLEPKSCANTDDIIDADEDNPNLTSFYSESLELMLKYAKLE